MNNKRLGAQTVALRDPPSVLSFSNVGGKYEQDGPLAPWFDLRNEASLFGENTWGKGRVRHAEGRPAAGAGCRSL